MTALEAIHEAQRAGLTLEAVADGVRVKGPKGVRLALIPVLAPLASDILRLLTTGASRTDSALEGLEARPPCGECGRIDWIVTVLTDYGARFCPSCWTGYRQRRPR